MVASVFNIERFATEDGHGIRTVVFLKGCSLKCEWCANPESQSFKPEVLFNQRLCQGCGACVEACKYDAIDQDEVYGLISNPDKCVGCGACVEACVYNARTFQGQRMTVDELMEILIKDMGYYKKSAGGITFSGGEPLLQSEFIRQVALKLKPYGISILIETCGEVSKKNIDDVLDVVDIIYMDLKHMDSDLHKKYTGHDNKRILENIRYINDHFKGEMAVRYPYIPDINDDISYIDQGIEFINNLGNIQEIVFLPYHRLGLPKYLGLGRPYEMGKKESLKRSELLHLTERYKDNQVPVRIG